MENLETELAEMPEVVDVELTELQESIYAEMEEEF